MVERLTVSPVVAGLCQLERSSGSASHLSPRNRYDAPTLGTSV